MLLFRPARLDSVTLNHYKSPSVHRFCTVKKMMSIANPTRKAGNIGAALMNFSGVSPRTGCQAPTCPTGCAGGRSDGSPHRLPGDVFAEVSILVQTASEDVAAPLERNSVSV